MKIGILGGGQLARMLTLAAYPLGYSTLCFDPEKSACSKQVTAVMHANYDDKTALKKFAKAVDVITYETENIPLQAAAFVSKHKPLYPGLLALKISQNRILEKSFFQTQQIPTTNFMAVNNKKDFECALAKLGYPVILKKVTQGYDGKGQFLIRNYEESKKIQDYKNFIMEEFVPFDFEISCIAVREQNGKITFYPLTKNHHEKGILRSATAPYMDKKLAKKAQFYLSKIMQELNYVGVLTLEFFVKNGVLIANEMAPRVHNSGHWTIEGAHTSQFANHIRAITGLPLGSTEAYGQIKFTNFIGELPTAAEILKNPDAHYHAYGKAPKPGRKLGHVTLTKCE